MTQSSKFDESWRKSFEGCARGKGINFENEIGKHVSFETGVEVY